MTAVAAPSRTTAASRRPPRGRAVLLLPAALALLAGLDAALQLLELPAPVESERLPRVHGMLLVLGFVGTLIALERAAALQRRAAFLAPAFLGAGGLLLVTPLPLAAGQVALLLGALALVAVYVPLWRRQRDDAVLVQAFGTVLTVGATMLWLGGVGVPRLLPWLVGFIVLTIAGERLELARVAMGTAADRDLLLLSTGLVAGVVASLLWPPVGVRLLGLALLALVGWLAAHDVARRTVRTTGLTRLMAGCLLAGYGWLGVAGGVWLLGGPAYHDARYDAVVHAVFLGFTLSMIMAHAPVILPAVVRRPLSYHPAMWGPVLALHVSLVLRVGVGDAFAVLSAWRVGGFLNVLALVGFVAVAAWSATRRRRAVT